jgi:hypothetical protein
MTSTERQLEDQLIAKLDALKYVHRADSATAQRSKPISARSSRISTESS